MLTKSLYLKHISQITGLPKSVRIFKRMYRNNHNLICERETVYLNNKCQEYLKGNLLQ